MPGQHAKRSPSSAHRWLNGNCPGSVTLAQIAPSETSPYAERGTRAHVVVEHCLKNGLRIAAKCPRKLRAELNAEDLAAVQYCLDLVYMQADLMAGSKDGGKPEILTETVCSVADYLPDCWGTRDIVIWNFERVTVIDYKHGSGLFVPIENNPQLMIYLLGTYLELEHMTYEDCKWQIGIIQPRCKRGGKLSRFQTVTVEDILKFRDKLIEYDKTFNPWRFNTGEHCKWCPGISFCPAQLEQIAKAMIAAKIENKYPDNTKLVKWVLDHKENLKLFLSEIESYALGIRRRGVPIEGYKLVKANKRARWRYDNAAMMKIFAKTFDGETYRELVEAKPKSIGAVKKILGAEWVSKHIETPEGEPILVPAEDKRPEIGAFADFED